MAAKHTPGPWHVVATERRIGIYPPNVFDRPAGAPLYIGSRALEFVPRKSGAGRGERVRYDAFSEKDQANAKLIAAAPDLAEALEGFLRAHAEDGCCGPGAGKKPDLPRGTTDYCDACTAGRAALHAAGRP